VNLLFSYFQRMFTEYVQSNLCERTQLASTLFEPSHTNLGTTACGWLYLCGIVQWTAPDGASHVGCRRVRFGVAAAGTRRCCRCGPRWRCCCLRLWYGTRLNCTQSRPNCTRSWPHTSSTNLGLIAKVAPGLGHRGAALPVWFTTTWPRRMARTTTSSPRTVVADLRGVGARQLLLQMN
jgi:hypothetical protein